MGIEKLERDGKVAVVYSPGYGAGWSTWASSDAQELLMFDREIAEAVLSDDVPLAWELAKDKTEALDVYVNDQDLYVRWVPKGSQFKIQEYDGSETVEILGEVQFYTA